MTPMLAALFLAAVPVQAATVDLYRGATLAGQPFKYWDVTDTYLDSSNPQTSFGGDGVLLGGTGKTILIKFGDLQRVVNSGTVKSATLILSPSGGAVPEFKSISRLLVPFGEGPVNSLASVLERNMNAKNKVAPPVWSSTWQNRRSGPNWAWQSAGARGNTDAVAIDAAAQVNTEQTIQIGGLAADVQYMAEHPDENNGFAVSFSNAVEFFSSNTPGGRPRLRLEIEPRPPQTGTDLSVTYIEQMNRTPGQSEKFIAHVKNVGTAAASGFLGQWVNAEKPGANVNIPSLAPGAETTVSYERAFVANATDHRTQPLGFRVSDKGDVNPSNNSLTVFGDGKLIRVATDAPGLEDAVQAQLRFFNETVAPQSRFSFARQGALERLSAASISTDPANADVVWKGALTTDPNLEFQRALLRAAGVPNLEITAFPAGTKNALANRGSVDPYPGLGGYGDTRFEGSLLGTIALLYEPYSNPALDIQPLEPTGLLSATDVAIINQTMDGSKTAEEVLNKMTTTVLLHAMDVAGRPLPGMELSFFQANAGVIKDQPPAFTVVTDERGAAMLPNQGGAGPFGKVTSDGGNAVFLVRASNNGVTEWGWLKGWQLVDSYFRGGTGATVFDMRFDLPGAPLDTDADVAKDRAVTDSADSLPAKLAGITDGDSATAAALPGKDGWIEIDLGRDRTIGEIDLLATPDQMWPKFDIMVYSTGEQASKATVWAKEVKWDWTASNRRDLLDGANAVAYRGLPLRVRFIRIVNRSDQAGRLNGIRILGAKV
jgi:hypothetical protein